MQNQIGSHLVICYNSKIMSRTKKGLPKTHLSGEITGGRGKPEDMVKVGRLPYGSHRDGIGDTLLP
jgi:hypothetical protein